MTANQALAIVRLLIAIGVLLVIYRQRCARQNIYLGIPIIAWMAHVVIYLAAYLVISSIGSVPTQLFNVWSASLQIRISHNSNHGNRAVLPAKAGGKNWMLTLSYLSL